MTTIRLHNTATRAKETFTPIDPANVRMYVCGPTVYDRAHLGNARPVVVFDTLFRLLRHVYGADHVTYVRNFTDVDDKINAEALRRREAGAPGTLEELIHQRTEETIGWYHADMDALGALRPTSEPRATEYIGPMVAMIEDLIARGHAYVAQGHVLFDVRSYAGYGKLSGRSVDDMIAGARVDVAPFKRDPMDFVLWKPSDAETPGWDSPWGRGRPGWHIECSAMSHELLGPAFDIHGGGIDLQFPHHENEIAQSRCAHPEHGFAKVWMHNEMLQVEGKKMSKSLGNFFTVRDLLDQGVPGEVIRFVLLMTHYRSPMDWTAEKEREARDSLDYLYRKIGNVSVGDAIVESRTLDALTNDLNTPEALHWLLNEATYADGNPTVAQTLKATGNLLGLLTKTSDQWFRSAAENLSSMIDELLRLRADARLQKNWSLSDRIRDGLAIAKVKVMDGSDGSTWELEQVDSQTRVAASVNRAIAEDDDDSAAFWKSIFEAMVSGKVASVENREAMVRQLLTSTRS
jgi:cysteinyl-tRNA synthetase